MRVALLIPYFGRLPPWFPYYAESLSTVTKMDVHLFTDTTPSHDTPSNLHVHKLSLQQFCRLATKKTGVSVAFSSPHKCCDLKPAYGHIFEDFIGEYPFWAYGDLDVVYGELDAAIEAYCRENDVVSFRKRWISGSLCFLRNNEFVKYLYSRSPDWQAVFSTPHTLSFDELGGPLYQEVLSGADILSLHGGITSFTHVVKSLEKTHGLPCVFEDLICEHIPWGKTLKYSAGKIQDLTSGEEVLCLHWVIMKRRFFHTPAVQTSPPTFFIKKTGMYSREPGIYESLVEAPGRIIKGVVAMANRKIRRI